GRLFGIVDLNDVKKVKPADWDRVTVEKIARPVTEENSVSPDQDAMDVLSSMRINGRSRLLVTAKDGALVGILTLKDLLDFFALKIDLEESFPETKI
ncbi:MAG: CBS domain-containing protein, partial [Sphingomonadales bacterium]